MKIKKKILFAFNILFSFVTISRPIATSNEIGKIEQNIITPVKRVIDVSNEIDNEDPNFILENTINEYQNQFKNYIDITGLNVFDKEAIELPNFDLSYVAPNYTDIMLSYQTNLENSLSTDELAKYEELRKQNYNFDRYVSLNKIKYKNLHHTLKYDHKIIPIEPLNPITPLNHIINPSDITTRAAVATTTIVTILTNAGLSQTVISAFTACISTITTGLSTSWIPFIGWALAVTIVVGALIALTVIIVQNWDTICNVIDEIKAWFLEQFARFATLINNFFDDAISKGNESTISSTVVIGDKTLDFSEIRANDVTSTVAIAEQCRRQNDVLLIKSINNKGMQIALTTPVSKDFCVTYKTHINGYSSYTWYQNTARQLIITAGSGYTSATPDLHLISPTNPNAPELAFKHFHNYDALGNRINSPKSISKVHSFFGLLYYSPNKDGTGEIHPLSPKY